MIRSNSNSVQYGAPGSGKHAVQRQRAGRQCEVTTCVTVLSTYNAAGTCWLHTTATRKHALAPTLGPIH
jgi:hypothetical protein